MADIDALLDDARLFEPFRAFFDPTHGRPSIPMETYLRMMFLKYRDRLGFEPLCAEVADSLAWRWFCRIPLGSRVPHPTTLMKITSRCGLRAIDELNETLLAKAHENKLLRLDKVRADTTVVEANLAHPTGSGLLAKGVANWPGSPRRSTRPVWRRAPRRGIEPGRCAAGYTTSARGCGAAATRPRRRCWPSTARWLPSRSVPSPMPAGSALNARHGLRRNAALATGKTLAILAELERTAVLVERVSAQIRVRLAGEVPDGSAGVVSLHDPNARPIAKGRLGRPVEFGYKVQVVDNADGVVVDHSLHVGNPSDAPLLVPAIARVIARFGRAPAGRHRGPRLRRSRRRSRPRRPWRTACGDSPQGSPRCHPSNGDEGTRSG